MNLVATAVPALLEQLLTLCESAGTTPVVAADAAALARAWSGATTILIDTEQGARVSGLPQRPGVVVVGGAADPLWEVAARIGADHVAMLPSAASWLVALLSAHPDRASERAPVVCVMAGHGGGGATTFAGALARRAASRGLQTLLVDADPRSGGLDLAMGLETATGDRWPQVMPEPFDRQDVPALAPGFLDRLPGRGALRVLSADRHDASTGSVEAGLPAVLTRGRQRCDLVVVDLPRGFDAIAEPALAVARRTYLVVAAQVRAAAAAAALAAALRERCPDVRAIIRGPAPGGLSPAGIARSLGLPVATLRAEPGLIRDYERGVPPGQPRGPLARLCDDELTDLGAAAGRAGAGAAA